ncbi:MAG TPA: hypothetical protein VHT53_07580 [Candidatus Elarobacter sp.]|nr:hypothetical protein [Candidatus Elarobacter sp.]
MSFPFLPRVVFAATAALALAAAAAPLTWPTALPTTAPAPSPTVLWSGAPATSFALETEPLGVTPDGLANVLVRVVLRDPSGAVVRLRRGADFDFFTDRGDVQWQTRLRYGGPAAIVSVRDDGVVHVRAVANVPAALGTASATFDTRAWRFARVAAGAVGPHLVRVGWFPRAARGDVRIERDGRVVARVAADTRTWDDAGVVPGALARYHVLLADGETAGVRVQVPPELPVASAAVLRGKSAWLAFSGDPLDDASYARLDPAEIAAVSAQAGLRAVELRLAYGAFDEVTPAAKPAVDAIVDGLAARGIAVLAWTVPRTASFEDVARAAASAAYRTSAGTRVAGLAVDLERGGEFMGSGPRARDAMTRYLGVLRRAVGPRALLVATVEDPYLERLGEADVPYREIARDADVLQPMTYWRMLGAADTPAAVDATVAASVATLRRLAGRAVPIDVGAQTGVLSKRGAPAAGEIAAAVAAARRAGALGVAFYDWTGTGPEQWGAVAQAPWSLGSAADPGRTRPFRPTLR